MDRSQVGSSRSPVVQPRSAGAEIRCRATATCSMALQMGLSTGSRGVRHPQTSIPSSLSRSDHQMHLRHRASLMYWLSLGSLSRPLGGLSSYWPYQSSRHSGCAHGGFVIDASRHGPSCAWESAGRGTRRCFDVDAQGTNGVVGSGSGGRWGSRTYHFSTRVCPGRQREVCRVDRRGHPHLRRSVRPPRVERVSFKEVWPA